MIYAELQFSPQIHRAGPDDHALKYLGIRVFIAAKILDYRLRS